MTGNYTAFFLNKKRNAVKSAPCRYGKAGDHVWIRECLIPIDGVVCYEADRKPVNGGGHEWGWKVQRLAAMYMPHWACRSTAVIQEIRTQRAQQISVKDAVAEGMDLGGDGAWYSGVQGFIGFDSPIGAYAELWDHINGPKSWDKNPWLFALTLRRLT